MDQHDQHSHESDAFADGAAPPWLAQARPTDHADPFARDAAPASDAQWQSSLLEGLTGPQKAAVLHTEGPLLVLAAAGSGKTRVITRRIAYLISCGVPAWSILALTFTNKAAGEMRERVLHLLGGAESRKARGLTVTTFHSLCARLLRRYAQQAGLKDDFTIYDSGDQASLVKKVIEQAQLSSSNFPPRSVLSAISHAKNQLLSASDYAARAHDFSSRNIAKIYAGYEKALRAANAVDFDDLLLLTARLLKSEASVRRELQERWQYQLIDEYQDTNRAQFVIASMIAGEVSPAGVQGPPRPNICVVGDPDQAIYAWRGADITNILDFEQHYPRCAVITLGENFRSDAPILRAADTLIRHNKRRKHKDLFTSRDGGEPIAAILCREERHEAALIVDWFKRLKDGRGADEGARPLSWKDCAVFYRTNALSRVLEDAFRGAGIPYTIARGTAFFDREEVKNALAYLRVIANPSDDVSLDRIVNTPSRGISDATVEKLETLAVTQGVPLLRVMQGLSPEHAEQLGLTSRASNAIAKFVQHVQTWRGEGSFLGAQTSGSLAALVDRVVKESGLEAMYTKQAAQSQSESDAERLDNLAELVSSAREFELEYDPAGDALQDPLASSLAPSTSDTSHPGPRPLNLIPMLAAFLESVALVADADSVDPSQGSVTLMTLHAAKGLEFPAVAMVGLEEGLLPHSRAVMSPTDDEMEEERRLCFVGITRAMKHLLLTAAKYRTMRGTPERTIPSRFLAELPTKEMVVSDQAGEDARTPGGWDQGEDFEDTRSIDRDDYSQISDHERGPRPALSHSLPASVSRAGSARGPGASNSPFPPGTRVRHPQFGVGTVRSVTGCAQAKAIIEFRDAGVKTLVLEYARLVRM